MPKPLTTALLYFHTLRHLRPGQVINRVTRRLPRRRPRTMPRLSPRTTRHAPATFLNRRPCYRPEGCFTFLNETRRLEEMDGWSDPDVPLLWLYNLHYFDWLAQSGPVDQRHRQATIDRWIEDNGGQGGVGWQPYPTSLRIVNWIKWQLSGNPLNETALSSLADQISSLDSNVEYHLLGNHLLANAKALYLGGLFFSGQAADGWRSKGGDILSGQITEQVLADGGHFERSPMYHCIVLEDLLDVINATRVYGMSVPDHWTATVAGMLDWLVTMTRPDGRFPLFNDAADAIAGTPSDLLDYASRLNAGTVIGARNGMTHLPETGYFRYQTDRYSFFGDAGDIGPDYLPGHAHADTFTFELCCGNDPLIVDRGTSTYEKGRLRLLERGTVSHNTVQLGDLDQSEVWSAFRVARRAKVVDVRVGRRDLEAAHTGYDRVGVRHRRRFCFEDDRIVILDKLDATAGTLPATARLHFAPGIVPRISANRAMAGPATITFEGARDIRIADYQYAPEFNKRVPAKCLAVRFDRQLKTELVL